MDLLYEKLTAYRDSDYYGFHMPGHKRNPSVTGVDLPYGIDITEIEGFDDLHHAKEILKQAQERAAQAYGAEETCYLVNGSTSGILSAVMGCTRRGDRILVARNCHKSVYHAIELQGLIPVYLYPEFDPKTGVNGPIRGEAVRKALAEWKDKEIRAVVITSPTYDGVLSDIAAIAEAVHEYGIPLIVDEAHGAHFGFHPYFPENSNAKGADVVIHSLHKTLPSLTQTALIHMNGNLADRESIRRYLHIFQTSSPSYVLMSGMDVCVGLLMERGADFFENYVEILDAARRRLKELRCLKLVETELYDRSKIVISVRETGRTGKELSDWLRETHHLEMEMAAGSYIVAMTAVGDTAEGMERLVCALEEYDRDADDPTGDRSTEWTDSLADGRQTEQAGDPSDNRAAEEDALPELEQVYTAGEIQALKKQKNCATIVPWEQCEDRISMEYAYLYPPGIPLIVPGERISKRAVRTLQRYRKMGFDIEGLKLPGCIEVKNG